MAKQAKFLSQWMGCARVIWNAKCEEDRYLRKFAAWCLPVGTFPPIDQGYSQYKTDRNWPFQGVIDSQLLIRAERATGWDWRWCYRPRVRPFGELFETGFSGVMSWRGVTR